MRECSFSLDVPLVGKARPRVRRDGRAFTPAKTAAFERAVGLAARAAMQGEPFAGGCSVAVFADVEMPRSWSTRKRAEMAGRPHTQKPDKDNCLKAICDALNGIVWHDDAQAALMLIEVRWSAFSRLRVTVREMER